jgi:hypothetical protein
MSERFKAELKGLKELLEVEDKIVDSKRKKVKACVLRYAQNIRTNAMDKLKSMKAINTGILRTSILAELTEDNLSAEIGPTEKYGPYVEFGTQPHWPPLEALEDWARKHGIPAFIVARAIARRGTFARPYLAPAHDIVAAYFDEDLAKIYEESEL